MSDIPCKDCITLAICSNESMLLYSPVSNLMAKCDIIDKYIRSDGGSISMEKCLRVHNFLKKVNNGKPM